eukprot:m.57453 g.57453  ORF g.57453 m.57453 type:complete len:579 (-) comp12744_c0_seq1:2546-4282(-)
MAATLRALARAARLADPIFGPAARQEAKAVTRQEARHLERGSGPGKAGHVLQTQAWRKQLRPAQSGVSRLATNARTPRWVRRAITTTRSILAPRFNTRINPLSLALLPFFAVGTDRNPPEAVAEEVRQARSQCLPSSPTEVLLAQQQRVYQNLSAEEQAVAGDATRAAILEWLCQETHQRNEQAEFGGTVQNGTRRVANPETVWELGRDYRIVRHLNPIDDPTGHEGANSDVFHIECPDGRTYALKAMLNYTDDPAAASAPEYLEQRFGPEWRMLQSLPSHPHIVPLLHVYFGPSLPAFVCEALRPWVADQTAFLVLPLFRGGSLQSFMVHQKNMHDTAPFGLSWRFFLLTFLQQLVAVQHVRDNGIMHKDLTQAQFLIDASGKVVLADFGEARAMAPDGNRLRLADLGPDVFHNEMFHYTVNKAPELKGPIDGFEPEYFDELCNSAELWSVGAMMHAMLKNPRSPEDLIDRLQAASTGDAIHYEDVDLPQPPTGCPARLAQALLGITRCNPNDRMSFEQAQRLLQQELWGQPPANGGLAWAVQRRKLVLQSAFIGVTEQWEADLNVQYLDDLIQQLR